MFFVLTDYWPSAMGDADVREVHPLSVAGVNRVLGQPLPDDFPELSILVADLDALPPFFWAGDYFLMNQTAIEAVEQTGEKHLQIRPVRIEGVGGGADTLIYRHVHFLDHIDCLDASRSKVELDEDGQISEIRQLVLDEHKIPAERHLFRISVFPVYLISERLRDHFARVGIPPIAFQQTDEYDSQDFYWPEPSS